MIEQLTWIGLGVLIGCVWVGMTIADDIADRQETP